MMMMAAPEGQARVHDQIQQLTSAVQNMRLGPSDPARDANLLASSLGASPDHALVISILTGRNVHDIQAIRAEFAKTGKKLEETVLAAIGGTTGAIMRLLVLSPAEADAEQLFKAMDGVGTTESTLIEILTTRTNAEIQAIKAHYQTAYGAPLEVHIKKETRGHFEKGLVALLMANRDESAAVDANRARMDAEILYRAGEKKLGTDEDKFIEVLARGSVAHNLAVQAEYAKVSSKGLHAAIESECSGSFRDLLHALSDAPRYFASQVDDAVAGLGTNDKKLARLLTGVRDSKKRVELAKAAYLTHFKKTMMSAVEGDTSGTLKQTMRRLLCTSSIDYDAVSLRESMAGVGTDNNLLIRTITSVVNKGELAALAASFEKNFGKSLVAEIKSEVSGNLGAFLVSLVTPAPRLFADQLHHAISGVGTRESVLIEVLGSRPSAEIQQIAATYREVYKTDLYGAIQGDTTGKAEKILTHLISGKRSEAATIAPELAHSEAEALYAAGQGRWGTDDDAFIAKLCAYSPAQLAVIAEDYARNHGTTLYDAIKKEASGSFETFLLGTLEPDRFLAEMLHKALAGMGTDDHRLIAILASRNKAEIIRIGEVYEKIYKKTLASDIKGDTSGGYQKALLAWVTL